MDNMVFVIDVSDKRNQYLLRMLSEDGYKTEAYDYSRKLSDRDKKYIYVFAPATEIDTAIADSIADGSKVFCLRMDSDIIRYLRGKDVEVIRFFDDEVLAMQNAQLTAEGALAQLILNTPLILRKNNILVIGYGRLGKTMTKVLKDVDANVYVGTNCLDEIAQASVIADYTCLIRNCKKHLPYFAAIVNTVPALILGEEQLLSIKKECFILDLASKPGGVDHEKAKELGLNCMHYLGVPGKVSPLTAAEQIRGSILKIIYRQKVNYD